jgi:hypothetical protein
MFPFLFYKDYEDYKDIKTGLLKKRDVVFSWYPPHTPRKHKDYVPQSTYRSISVKYFGSIGAQPDKPPRPARYAAWKPLVDAGIQQIGALCADRIGLESISVLLIEEQRFYHTAVVYFLIDCYNRDFPELESNKAVLPLERRLLRIYRGVLGEHKCAELRELLNPP